MPNSDTIVGLPLRQSTSLVSTLTEAPDVDGDEVTLTISGSMTAGDFDGTHYVKFVDGDDSGKWFAVVSNTTDEIVIDLNGDSIAADDGDQLEVLKFWTLGELFDPTVSTTDPTTTGNAIVASTNQLASGRRTSILIPDFDSPGINLATTATYYVNDGIWKRQGSGATNFSDVQLWPDAYFIIRHPAAVTSSTSYVVSGEVEPNDFAVVLSTRTGGSQDNFVAIPRPVDTSLNDLNLGGTSAFESSTNQLASGRRDQLFVFDNTATGQNKATVATYYYNDGIWKRQGGGAADFGSTTIPAGAAILIRKYQTTGGESSIWINTPSY